MYTEEWFCKYKPIGRRHCHFSVLKLETYTLNMLTLRNELFIPWLTLKIQQTGTAIKEP